MSRQLGPIELLTRRSDDSTLSRNEAVLNDLVDVLSFRHFTTVALAVVSQFELPLELITRFAR